MTLHEVRLKEQYCDAVLKGEKNFEVRKNDRGYQKGDHIKFIPVDKDGMCEVFHEVKYEEFVITYVHSGYGLENGFVILGIQRIQSSSTDNS